MGKHCENLAIEQINTLHCIQEIRRKKRLSLRDCARKLGLSVEEASRQEQPTTDLRIAELGAWAHCLRVELTDLLCQEHDPLYTPLFSREQGLRFRKIATAIQQRAKTASIRRFAQLLLDQIAQLCVDLPVLPGENDDRGLKKAR